MRIGNRYLPLGFLIGVLFVGFTSVVLLFNVGGLVCPVLWSVFSITFWAIGWVIIHEVYCPRCRKFLTAKQIKSSSITENVTERTYSCVNCGEEWTKEIDTSGSSGDYERPW